MQGERLIPATKQTVWEGLNDTEILRVCIPGCESLEATTPTQFKARAGVKLGPISAKFTGQVTLSDLDPPNGYTITGEGQGGVAGFAKGGASVVLTDEAGGTLLRYTVNAQVGGKIAQLGARLIDATAKSMAEQFFDKFSAELQKQNPVAVPDAVSPVAGTVPPSATRPIAAPSAPSDNATGRRELVWWGVGIAAIVVAVVVVWRLVS